MAEGKKPLEDFALITVLDKGDTTEYVVPTVNSSFHTLSILT